MIMKLLANRETRTVYARERRSHPSFLRDDALVTLPA
jgi:hypothetical protein